MRPRRCEKYSAFFVSPRGASGIALYLIESYQERILENLSPWIQVNTRCKRKGNQKNEKNRYHAADAVHAADAGRLRRRAKSSADGFSGRRNHYCQYRLRRNHAGKTRDHGWYGPECGDPLFRGTHCVRWCRRSALYLLCRRCRPGRWRRGLRNKARHEPTVQLREF